MNNIKIDYPITPPLELVQEWRKSGPADAAVNNAYEKHIATQAARWGANQELEACCEWVDAEFPTYPKCDGPASYRLADARRPKPPNLADSAKESLESVVECLKMLMPGVRDAAHIATIRAALERLQELEKGNE